MNRPMKNTFKSLFSLPVAVAALGCFVDIYDLLLFGIVRTPSLESLGLNAEEVSLQGDKYPQLASLVSFWEG